MSRKRPGFVKQLRGETEMRRWLLVGLIPILVFAGVMEGCARTEVTQPEQETPSPEEAIGTAKITLGDAPNILDVSSELSGDFKHETFTSQKMADYLKLGLGPWSDWQIFHRDNPLLRVSSTMTVLSNEQDRIACAHFLQNPGRIASRIDEGYRQEDGDFKLIAVEVNPVDIGDVAVLILEEKTLEDEYLLFSRDVYFRHKDVVVYITTLYSKGSPPSTIDLAKAIELRIEDYYK